MQAVKDGATVWWEADVGVTNHKINKTHLQHTEKKL